MDNDNLNQPHQKPMTTKNTVADLTRCDNYFAYLNAVRKTISLNTLEKAGLHASQYLALDPLEKIRRQVEQTLEAKLGLLQTKLENARDPMNKTQRRIYIGNLTP